MKQDTARGARAVGNDKERRESGRVRQEGIYFVDERPDGITESLIEDEDSDRNSSEDYSIFRHGLTT
jgi:hypothetical protein